MSDKSFDEYLFYIFVLGSIFIVKDSYLMFLKTKITSDVSIQTEDLEDEQEVVEIIESVKKTRWLF